MVNKIVITLLLILISFFSSAQKIRYEKLDSISIIINKLQLKVDNLTYNDGKDDYILSFPENNFQLLYSTERAQKSVYKKKGNTESLYLTEDIDLAKISGINQSLHPGQVGVVRLTFQGGVKTRVYTNGIYTNTIIEDYLEFFYDRNTSGYFQDLDIFFENIMFLFKNGE